MSTPNDVPTLDQLRSMGTTVFSSMDMLRVRWRPFGPLQSTFEVAEDLSAGPNSSVSPYQLSTGINPSFHEIAKLPATEPPVSLITVTLSDLEDWPWCWQENHEDCWEGYDDEHQKWTEGEEEDEEGEEEEGGHPRKLMRCCDENRPSATPPLTVHPTAQDFITIHDYITQVHVWIENLKDDIVAATKESVNTHPSTPRYMSLLRLDAPHVRDDVHSLADHHWKRVAEHAQLRRDGRMIGRNHAYEEPMSLLIPAT